MAMAGSTETRRARDLRMPPTPRFTGAMVVLGLISLLLGLLAVFGLGSSPWLLAPGAVCLVLAILDCGLSRAGHRPTR